MEQCAITPCPGAGGNCPGHISNRRGSGKSTSGFTTPSSLEGEPDSLLDLVIFIPPHLLMWWEKIKKKKTEKLNMQP
jgi:hypothetical protein